MRKNGARLLILTESFFIAFDVHGDSLEVHAPVFPLNATPVLSVVHDRAAAAQAGSHANAECRR